MRQSPGEIRVRCVFAASKKGYIEYLSEPIDHLPVMVRQGPVCRPRLRRGEPRNILKIYIYIYILVTYGGHVVLQSAR